MTTVVAQNRFLSMGYDIDRFTEPVNEGLLCCICRDVLEDPLQAACEHAFCSSCIHGWLVQEHTCPEDRQLLLTSHLRPLFRYMRNDLDRLQIRCRNVQAGCTTVCNLEYIDAHENDCQFHTIECSSPGCTVMLERRELDEHLVECDFRRTLCPQGCGLPILNAEDTEHSCIAEMRTALDLLHSEMICKVEEQKQEMELRLDAQRRHMVQREITLQTQVDELKSEVSRLSQELRVITQDEHRMREEIERNELEKRELLDLLKCLQKDLSDATKRHICKYCSRTEKITAI